MRRLNDLLNLTTVPRWGIARMTRTQSVAEHSHRVAVIAVELARHLAPGLETGVAHWAILHDATESMTGDPPAPFKDSIGRKLVNDAEATFCGWLREIKEEHMVPTISIVKIADVIEGYTWWQMFGDKRMNHPWIIPNIGPVACNRNTVMEMCVKHAPIIRLDALEIITLALRICNSIVGEYNGIASEIASEQEARAFIRGNVQSQGASLPHDDTQPSDPGR